MRFHCFRLQDTLPFIAGLQAGLSASRLAPVLQFIHTGAFRNAWALCQPPPASSPLRFGGDACQRGRECGRLTALVARRVAVWLAACCGRGERRVQQCGG